MPYDLPRRLAAEAIGTALLVAAIVGSGIMVAALTADTAVALLANSLATGAALVVLIALLAPISGAHFNPLVSLVGALRGEMAPHEATLYVIVQIAAGIAGTLLAHLMFGLPLVTVSAHARTGGGQWLAEGVAAFGLIFAVLVGSRVNRASVPWLVGLYIVAAYWFTASTSFANPAVAIARAFTDTFAGIRPVDVPGFVAAEVMGALVALAVASWLLGKHRPRRHPPA